MHAMSNAVAHVDTNYNVSNPSSLNISITSRTYITQTYIYRSNKRGETHLHIDTRRHDSIIIALAAGRSQKGRCFRLSRARGHALCAPRTLGANITSALCSPRKTETCSICALDYICVSWDFAARGRVTRA